VNITQTAKIKRRDLFDLVWSRPMTVLAAELDTNDYHLRSLCRRLGLPVPVGGHWMKAEAGKAPPKPPFPADPQLDPVEHAISKPASRRSRPGHQELAAPVSAEADQRPEGDDPAESLPHVDTGQREGTPSPPHKLVKATRAALARKPSGARTGVSGPGKFRLLVSSETAERACALLDRIIEEVQAAGWDVQDGGEGYQLVPDGEPIGFMIEEKLDPKPHVPTPEELKELAEYERKCALADRGIGFRPWRPPQIPENDYFPSGLLVIKLDEGRSVAGLRRTFSDGKRQRLEELIPALIQSLSIWAAGQKAFRAEQERWRREFAEEEARRRAAESRQRVDGYRLTFLARQAERLEEIGRLERVLSYWADQHPQEEAILKFMTGAYARLEAQKRLLSPEEVSRRIASLRLLEDDIYIYDQKQIG
jgi:hypothetical protein